MEQQQQQPHISVISWIELLVGCRDGETSRVHAWLESFPRVPLDEAIATEKDFPLALGGGGSLPARSHLHPSPVQ